MAKAKKKDNEWSAKDGHGAYILGMIGAFVFYLQSTQGVWQVVVAFLKACVWPAFLVYKLFELVYS